MSPVESNVRVVFTDISAVNYFGPKKIVRDFILV